MEERNILLFDDPAIREELLPFTFTRPVADIRIGILTIREKWEHTFNTRTSSITQPYLAQKFPRIVSSQNLAINGAVLPDEKLVDEINLLQFGEILVKDGITIAAWLSGEQVNDLPAQVIANPGKVKACHHDIIHISHLWDIFSHNGIALERDFKSLTKGRKSQPLNDTNQILGAENIFVEQGAIVNCSILNATTGPIYIGKNAEVMEGSIIRGPFALCENSVTKLGAKIYGPTTIGPFCKAGGEITNSVMFGFSSKAHDGFLGNSVIGEWCNLGADSNNSNLKNNYASVKLWSYPKQSFEDTGLQFCGLFMGDHSKCGINTMFNTGTVVGISANIFGAGFPRNFIPSFSWGGKKSIAHFKLEKAFEVAEKVMQRRKKTFDETDKQVLTEVFKLTEEYRTK